MAAQSCLTIGNIDHIAFAVPDADAAASVYEQRMGWQRFADFDLLGDAAATVARIIGIPRLDRIRSVIVTSPGHSHGTVEFVELSVAPRDGEPPPELPTGFIVTSYRMADVRGAFHDLVAGGFEPLCQPATLDIMGLSVLVASVRGPHPGIIELVGAP